MSNSKYISCADTAKLVRAVLAKSFPGVTFSVRSHVYSMGASIDVKWVDGPTTTEVDNVVKQFGGSSFDGMQDLKSYHDSTHPDTGELVHYAADHIHTTRDYTPEFYRRMCQIVADRWGCTVPEIKTHKSGSAYIDDFRVENAREYFGTLVYRESREFSGFAPKAKTVKGVLVFEAAVYNGEDGHYISGDTWPNQRTLKEAGGKWIKDRKAYWLVGEIPESIKTLSKSPEEVQQIRGQKVAEKFRQMAETLQGQIENKRREHNWNPTYRRNRIEEGLEADALKLEVLQDKLSTLATAHEAGTIPELLKGITTKAQLEDLIAYETLPSGENWGGDVRKRMADAGLCSATMYSDARLLLRYIGKADAGKETEESKLRKLEKDIVLRKIDGFFPTPANVVQDMIQAARIEDGMSILEPSAGKGDIADALRKAYPNSRLTLVEWNRSLCDLLELKGYNEPVKFCLYQEDFTAYADETIQQFDRILMNPPFEDNQDIDHVRAAYGLLDSLRGGILVAIMSEHAFFATDKKAVAFRAWLDAVGGTNERLEQGAFLASDRPTGVASRMVTIQMQADPLNGWHEGLPIQTQTTAPLADSDCCWQGDTNVYPFDTQWAPILSDTDWCAELPGSPPLPDSAPSAVIQLTLF